MNTAFCAALVCLTIDTGSEVRGYACPLYHDAVPYLRRGHRQAHTKTWRCLNKSYLMRNFLHLKAMHHKSYLQSIRQPRDLSRSGTESTRIDFFEQYTCLLTGKFRDLKRRFNLGSLFIHICLPLYRNTISCGFRMNNFVTSN